MEVNADIAIVGGGLAGCLTAVRLVNAKPNLRVILVEEKAHLGGHSTWIFRESDISADSLSWVQPIIEKTWASCDVNFPRQQKTIEGNVCSFRSATLHSYLTKRLADNVFLNAKATRITESHVELQDQRVISARCVIDARGFTAVGPSPAGAHCGYRKYMSREFLTTKPHGVKAPLMVDANVPQLDGLRYFRLFPWDEQRLVVEEIFYSNTPELNAERIGRSLLSYIDRHGWKIQSSEREESGCQAMPMTSEYLTSSVGGEPLPIGFRGGYMHALTGEALPDAVRIADFLSSLEDLTTETARSGLMRFRRSWLSRQRFYRLLNRLMFYASEPALRYLVLQGFYTQSQDVIERFLSGRTTWSDRMRILRGRPPFPLDRALRSLTEKSVAHWPDRKASRES